MAATGRTYGKPAVYEVNPGIYDIELTAIAMDGLQSIHRLKDIEIKSGENKQLEHHYKTGIAMIGANSSGGLVDATVSIKDSKTKAVVSSSRTYIASTTNPKKFLLTPGMYEVTVTSVKGISKGQKQIFTIEVKAGVSLEKIIDF
jgi:Ca-activated chloride channel family protein